MDTLALILSMAIVIAAWICIFRKAGHSTQNSVLMGLALAVPLANLVVIAFFLFDEWPIQREVRLLRNDASALYSEGSRLEAKGDAKAALARYEEAIAASPSSAAARDADASIRHLKALVGQ